MSKRSADKRRGQRRHALYRLRQRYGIVVTADEYERLCCQVRDQRDVQLLRRQSNRVSLYVVWRLAVPLLAVYDHARSSIATFLPSVLMAVEEGACRSA